MAASTYSVAGSRPGGLSVITRQTQTAMTYMVAGVGAVTEDGAGPSPPAGSDQPPQVIIVT